MKEAKMSGLTDRIMATVQGLRLDELKIMSSFRQFQVGFVVLGKTTSLLLSFPESLLMAFGYSIYPGVHQSHCGFLLVYLDCLQSGIGPGQHKNFHRTVITLPYGSSFEPCLSSLPRISDSCELYESDSSISTS